MAVPIQPSPAPVLPHPCSFQREGVRRGVRFGGRCLLADEMGLGKTVQVLPLLSLCLSFACPLLSHLPLLGDAWPTASPLNAPRQR